MKKSLLFFLVILVISCATIPPEQLTKQTIIDLPGMKKDQIFKKSMEWIAATFTSYKAVTDYTDKESGRILGNIVTSGTYSVIHTIYIKSKMTIEIKDAKTRLTFQPYEVTIQNNTRGIYDDYTKDIAHNSLTPVINSYAEFMQKKESSW